MAIKAKFTVGATSATTSPLHQWDYGQVLEIEAADLPTENVEVHFSCSGMSEAVIHNCNFLTGVCTVVIPNECLEQSHPITAWVYEIKGTTGTTTKTINIPIIARTRPASSKVIPEEISDKYSELITQVNDAIDSLENGEVLVGKAKTAEKAVNATAAENASSSAHANYATEARHADTATVVAPVEINSDVATEVKIETPGIYIVEARTTNGSGAIWRSCVIVIANLTEKVQSLIYDETTSTSSNTHTSYYVEYNQLASGWVIFVRKGSTERVTDGIRNVRRIATL